jgi:hypothetical protein
MVEQGIGRQPHAAASEWSKSVIDCQHADIYQIIASPDQVSKVSISYSVM